MASGNKAFTFVFTAGIAGVLLIIFGLIGYMPPANVSLAGETWRLGTWSDGVIVGEIALGSILLLAAAVGASRLNRRMTT